MRNKARTAIYDCLLAQALSMQHVDQDSPLLSNITVAANLSHTKAQ